ncbi:M12 family metallopeptidase [Sphaerisporangium corydalis]|uniref:M12 family metallopeptidase n=1 Tax=Sphaerisporangium corydalis TaxID=1441875 RepID=A0ABV9E8M9_9ACTN|nr:M12 family metallopeptidase [Sphaerisporangium corydalis]
MSVTLVGLVMGTAPGAEGDPFDYLWRQQSDRPPLSITTSDISGHQHTIGYVEIDGHAVTEGDIVIGTAGEAASGRIQLPGIFPEVTDIPAPATGLRVRDDPGGPARPGDCRRAGASTATTRAEALWPGGRVPYVLSPDLPVKARDAITAAMKDFQDQTCVRFVPRAAEAAFVQIVAGDGCYSYVGRVGGEPQELSIGRGCERKGIVIHELLHSIGFYHEHSRSDRDAALTVHLENVLKGYEPQFRKLPGTQNRLFGTLDYGSVMLYGRAFFSSNGKDTLVPALAVPIGQRIGFSPADLAAVRALYGCPEPPAGQYSSLSSRL